MAKSNFNFNVFAEKEKLRNNGSNFTNWFRNLRIILYGGQKDYVLENALGDAPAATAPADEKAVYQSRKDDYGVIKSTMLFAMESDLQNRFEEFAGPFEILEELKTIQMTPVAGYMLGSQYSLCAKLHTDIKEAAGASFFCRLCWCALSPAVAITFLHTQSLTFRSPRIFTRLRL